MTIDRKYKILAVNPNTGGVHDSEDSVLFLAKDVALIPTLETYHKTCKEMGCGINHILSVELLIARVKDYQRERITAIPDTDHPGEIRDCVNYNMEERK